VTNTDDSGSGSLRQAILDANGNPGLDTIAFNIGSGGVQTIQPMTALPEITDPVVIDGTTQPGFQGTPLIVLNGANAPTGANGLVISAGNSTVKGLVINAFRANGILLQSHGNDLIAGNYLGTDMAGTVAAYNGSSDISIQGGSNSNTIGGTTTADRNVLASNLNQFSLTVTGSGTVVEGNYIGTDVTGARSLSAGSGVLVSFGSDIGIGGTSAGAGNLISGHTNGVGVSFVGGGGNRVQGNRIGTDGTASQALGNSTGVSFQSGSTNNVVGGTVPGARNIISGSHQEGVRFDSGNNQVQGNYIGTDGTGTRALGNGAGVLVDTTSVDMPVIVGGTAAGAGNVISGNSTGVSFEGGLGALVQGNLIGTDVTGTLALGNGTGVYIDMGSLITVGGETAGARNVISGNSAYGVHLRVGGNFIRGNYIGTDATGTRALGNGTGIYSVPGGQNDANTIGGTAAGMGNLVSGNTGDGIYLGSNGNLMQGNIIGTDVTGTKALRNGYGVYVLGGSNNSVGGATAGARNLISGNSTAGVFINSSSNLVQGDFIGTDVTGTMAVGNGVGVIINAGSNSLIGGTATGAGNLISGNGTLGVSIAGSSNLVQGNLIGTNAASTARLGNVDGIHLTAGANNTTVGGTASGARNVIAGNTNIGIFIVSAGNLIQGNFIGTDAGGSYALSNGLGVDIEPGSINNTIGGTTSAARNLISGNSSDGIFANAGLNMIQGNYIGTDLTGTRALGNGHDGVDFFPFGSDNSVGGSTAQAGNLISGNAFDGIQSGGSGNLVQGNLIGTNSAGTTALSNGNHGVEIYSGNNNSLGGTAAAARNIISGNRKDGVVVAGSSNLVQGDFIGTDVTGTTPLANDTGIYISGANNTVGGTVPGAGNLISGNTTYGVEISGGVAAGNLVQGNTIGTDVRGTAALRNIYGVYIASASNNTIGGSVAGAGNLISGNFNGVVIMFSSSGGGDLVEGNLIGTDPTGTMAVGNLVGVVLQSGSNNTVGGTTAGTRNVISGNTNDGVDVFASGNLLVGNYIGTDATATFVVGNNHDGILIAGSNNTLGGTSAGAANVIGGNTADGVAVTGSSNLVVGNDIGLDLAMFGFLGNAVGVDVVGTGNVIGGPDIGEGNVISANRDFGLEVTGSANLMLGNRIGTDATGEIGLHNGAGILLSGSNNTVGGTRPGFGNLVSANPDNIVITATGISNLIQGCLIGTDATGTAILGGGEGIQIFGGSDNTIGGVERGAKNVISGNGLGIDLYSGAGNRIQGNFVGTDITGRFALSNTYGVSAQGPNTVIGGTTPGAGNVISGNRFTGLFVSNNHMIVEGNFIGTDVTGTIALGNGLVGVSLSDASDSIVGGTAPGTGNLISGNGDDGISISSGSGEEVLGNRIGTDVTGTVALGNKYGISIYNTGVIIGGSTAGAGNLISGNQIAGITMGGTGNVLQGNFIGTDMTGAEPLPNGLHGVYATGSNDLIGGTVAGAANRIAFNGGDGVRISGGTGNAIRENVILGHNAALGIELVSNANHGQEYPVLTSATSDAFSTTITGILASAPSTTFTVEFFANTMCNPSGYGEGERFLGSTAVTTDSDGNAAFTFTVPIPVDPGQFVSATATDPANNTSQFSACVEVTSPAAPGHLLSAVTDIMIPTGGVDLTGLTLLDVGTVELETTDGYGIPNGPASPPLPVAGSALTTQPTDAEPCIGDLLASPGLSDRFWAKLTLYWVDLGPTGP
jgi:hypothetical protein